MMSYSQWKAYGERIFKDYKSRNTIPDEELKYYDESAIGPVKADYIHGKTEFSTTVNELAQQFGSKIGKAEVCLF